MTEETKKCPYCDEKILQEAIKCKYCGEWLKDKEKNISPLQIIENYIDSNVLKTDGIIIKTNLTNDKIKESGLTYDLAEKPLLLLYKKSLFFDLKTRILITDKKIYYKALPDSFWTGITCNFVKKIEGSFELKNINQLSIANHDHCIGAAYVGHQLMINNTVVGLVRMGTGVDFDENIITYLNRLFEEIVSSNKIPQIKTDSVPKEIKKETIKQERIIDEVSDSGWTIVWKLFLVIIGAIILSNLFPHAFDSKIILTNEMTGQKIEIPVKTTRINGEKEYSVKIHILEGDEHTFYSKDIDALTKFITKVKNAEMRMRAEMQLKGQYVDKETTKFYSLDKMIYEIPKRQYHIYERTDNKGQPPTQEKTKNSTVKEKEDTLKEYQEDAKKAGVSPKCLQYRMTGIGDESCCTKTEALKADKYLKKMAEDGYCQDPAPASKTKEIPHNQDVNEFMN